MRNQNVTASGKRKNRQTIHGMNCRHVLVEQCTFCSRDAKKHSEQASTLLPANSVVLFSDGFVI
jgi:hypothetical protein